MLQLFASRATADQLARRYGALPATIEDWRDETFAAVDTAFKTGSHRNEDAVLSLENWDLKAAVRELSVQNARLQQA